MPLGQAPQRSSDLGDLEASQTRGTEHDPRVRLLAGNRPIGQHVHRLPCTVLRPSSARGPKNAPSRAPFGGSPARLDSLRRLASYPSFTSIFRGLAASFFGSVRVRTPCLAMPDPFLVVEHEGFC